MNEQETKLNKMPTQTFNELKSKVQKLINHYTEQKNEAIQISQQLFTKLNSLKELELLEKLPPYYLTAYLAWKQAYYSNYQEEHLQQANFDREKYLERLEKELELTAEARKKETIDDLLQMISDEEIKIADLTSLINQDLKNKDEKSRQEKSDDPTNKVC